jgi:hypothetical protein
MGESAGEGQTETKRGQHAQEEDVSRRPQKDSCRSAGAMGEVESRTEEDRLKAVVSREFQGHIWGNNCAQICPLVTKIGVGKSLKSIFPTRRRTICWFQVRILVGPPIKSTTSGGISVSLLNLRLRGLHFVAKLFRGQGRQPQLMPAPGIRCP